MVYYIGSRRAMDCEGVFRNCKAFVKGSFYIPLAQGFAHGTLLFKSHFQLLIWLGLILGGSFGFWSIPPMWLICSGQNLFLSSWKFQCDLAICFYRLSHIYFIVSHIYKECNQVVDKLASHAIQPS